MFHIGVIGYGMSAQTFHVPLITHERRLKLRAIASSKDTLPFDHNVRHYRDAEALMRDPELDAVVITAPNALHASLAEAALRQGKHVVLEKPMVTNLADAQRLVALAQQQQRQLAVFHNVRFNDDFLTLQSLIARGVLGEIKLLTAHWDRFRPTVRQRWREQAGAGSGFWFDLGPHMIDQTLCLFGMPEAVTARLRILRSGGESDDYAHVQLHYPQREVTLVISPFNNAPTIRFRAEGTLATFEITGLDPQEAQLKAGMTPESEDYGVRAEADNGLLYRQEQPVEVIRCERGQFQRFYANFAEAMAGESTLIVPPADAIEVMVVLDAAIRSSISACTVAFAS